MYNIAIIGGGCMGVASAVEIQKLLGDKVTVTIFAEKFTPDTTSDVAAGLWEPYLLGDTKPEDLMKFGLGTYNYLIQLWREGKAKEAGISLIPVINLVEGGDDELPIWLPITLGYSKLTPNHLESFNKQLGRQFKFGFSFISFTWEARRFLPYLMKHFFDNGGKTVQRRIDSFDELSNFDLIVNCTGLGAKEMLQDSLLTPIRGQIRRVKAPWQYTCYLIDYEKEDSCYIIPNFESVVLGGTKQKSFDVTLNESDKNRFEGHLEKLVPSLKNTEVVGDFVGLRPYRTKVRIEQEFWKTKDGKLVKVVHNYGHGGSGISLSVGCGQETAQLVKNILEVDKSKL
ncbi:hypothetical protein GWI33_019033 [Rhynchophorus ferrugineus]|uniref:FAD dependent oxidoreductase domain-containing protein n=1 Tax=Rhynchophorus ferrugineus TaxID=354439 RepID=A0A834M4L5_RHYFE|nr:hypothetical protein GWI33_019033 [Rhynchophorus ferrugineus]